MADKADKADNNAAVKRAALGRIIAVVGMAGLSAAPAHAAIDRAAVDRERQALQARVDAVRRSLAAPTPVARHWLAQAANWNNWPKWSKWSNWANQ